MKKIDSLKLKKIMLYGALGSTILLSTKSVLENHQGRNNTPVTEEATEMFVEPKEIRIEEATEEPIFLKTNEETESDTIIIESEPDETNKNLVYHYKVFEFTDENPEGIKTIYSDYATYTKFQDGIKGNRLYQYLYATEVIDKKCKKLVPYTYYFYNNYMMNSDQ